MNGLAKSALVLLMETDGFSLSMPEGNPPPNKGYMVSIKGQEVQIPLDQVSILSLQKYIDDHRFCNCYFGAWVHNGVCYLDTSICIDLLGLAVELGRANDQLAIWDLGNNEEIILGE